jgi:hypothetical protein
MLSLALTPLGTDSASPLQTSLDASSACNQTHRWFVFIPSPLNMKQTALHASARKVLAFARRWKEPD